MTASTLSPGQEHVHAIHRQTRTAWSVVMLVLSAVFLALSPLVPGAAGLLRVDLEATVPIAALFALTTVITAVVYHRHGWTRPYFIWNDVETAVSVGVALLLIYASGSALSIFWLFLLFTTFHCGNAPMPWSPSHDVAIFGAELLALTLAFALQGALADAALTLVFGVTIVWLLLVVSTTAKRLQVSLDRQAELQRRNEELLVQQERARIARDLHDGLGSDMAGLLFQVHALQAQAQGTEWEERLRPLSARLSSGADELRGVVWAMRAEPRPWSKLVAELSERCAAACRQTTLSVAATCADADVVIPGELAGAVVRIALESVRNADRHAHARAIALRLELVDQTVRVEVRDDGRGVPGAELIYSEGGLRNLRDRARELSGALEVSAAHPGTRIVFTAPISPQPQVAAAPASANRTTL